MPIPPTLKAIRRFLRRIEVAECNCPLKEVPCGCPLQRRGLPCMCIRKFVHCRHIRRAAAHWPGGEGFSITAKQWVDLLWALNLGPYSKKNLAAYREPPPPEKYTRTLNPERRIHVMARRLARGEHLYHPQDAQMLERDSIGYDAFRRRNGSAGVGEIHQRAA